MRYFYDSEFLDDGRTIEPVSLGIVAEDGREYYAVSTDFDPRAAIPWVQQHVLPQLPSPSHPAWRPLAQIRDDVEAFLTAADRPELWAWIGAYDHVLLGHLFGGMPAMPRALPRWTRDVRQLWWHLGEPALPAQANGKHDALADARHVRHRFQLLRSEAERRGLVM